VVQGKPTLPDRVSIELIRGTGDVVISISLLADRVCIMRIDKSAELSPYNRHKDEE